MRCTDLYRQYYRADKLVAELTKTRIWKSATREAKVIGIQQIELDSRAEAENVLALAQAEKSGFWGHCVSAKYLKRQQDRQDAGMEKGYGWPLKKSCI